LKAHLNCFGGRVTFEMEADNPKALFKKLALVQEVFGAEDKCGCCGSQDIVYRTRLWDGNDYYELHCRECGAAFAFGQKKDGGGLFPKRRDKEGDTLENGGWKVWHGGETRAEPVPPPPRSAPPQGPAQQPPRQPPPPYAEGLTDDDVPFMRYDERLI
jgi:hypothetical protein